MTTTPPCSLHTSHSPSALTVEQHHVIPQSWQRFWVPPGATVSGSLQLWDARTVPICPTGHRNVHTIIVAAMKYVAALKQEVSALTAVVNSARPGLQRDTALLALERFRNAGGMLLDLTAAGEWGEA